MPSTLGIVDSNGRIYLNEIIYGGSGATVNSGAYQWSFSGFGTKYANISNPFPPIPPTSTTVISDIDISLDGLDIAFAGQSTPYVAVYPWSRSSGFGTKYSDPATPLTDWAYGVSFSPSKTAIAVAGEESPYVHAYSWSNGFGSKYSDPASGLSTTGKGISFSADGNSVIASGGFNELSAWQWSNSTGFGTKYTNAASAQSIVSIHVSKSGSNIICANNNSSGPPVQAWPWSNGFGTRYANPPSFPTVQGFDARFSPKETAIVFGNSLDEAEIVGAYAYTWISGVGFGTKYSSSITNRAMESVDFSNTGDVVVFAETASPFLRAKKWSDSTGFGTTYANPSTAASDARVVRFVSK